MAPPERPTKVLFVSHASAWAGAESCLFELLRGLDPSRVEPLVVLPANGPLEKRLDDLGVPYQFGSLRLWIDQAYTDGWVAFGDGLARRVDAMARRIERERCDVVFTNTSVAFEGALAARQVGVPHVWRVHEMLWRHSNFGTRLPLSVYYAMLDALSDRVAVVSHAVRTGLLPHVRPERISVIPNGIDLITPRRSREALLGVDASVPVVVFVGTLSEPKGVPLLAPVMERVVREHPRALCVLVGEDVGAERALREDIGRRGLDKTFRFLGFRADAKELIAHADALILPSRVDSLPCVVMEAMAAGVPSVATESGGAAELIVDGVTGRLVPIDDVEAMATALSALFADPDLRRAMGEKALARARERFGARRYVAAFERLFAQLATSRPPPTRQPSLSHLIALLEAATTEEAAPADASRVVDHLRGES
jgi:glycosyltransferase involved in cell wall biosynthesis